MMQLELLVILKIIINNLQDSYKLKRENINEYNTLSEN